MKMKSLTLALIASGAIVTGTAGAVNWHPSDWFHGKAEAGTTKVADSSGDSGAPVTATGNASITPTAAPNYRAIVQRFGPAVVGINTEGTAKTSMEGGMSNQMPDDPFFRFFRGVPGFGNQMPREEVPVRGQGSGFIIGKDGLILTNAHVVRDADEVTVKLNDRREYKAKVLGIDTDTDVAILKIDAHDLPVVSLGDPAKLRVGDYVLAIGSPFGFEQSATAGIVSAKGRSLPGDSYVPFIQTDVAVNPGNSGGPLFDASGNVIGINSQIYSRTGGYMGVSFAIPIDVALRVKDQIVATGKATHAHLGVTIQEVNQALAESFKLPRPEGALVASVTPGSPAAKAGIEPGDVVLQYNGHEIDRAGDLPTLVGTEKPGEKVSMQVWRGGKKVDLNATLAAAKDVAAADEGDAAGPASGKLGLAVRPLTPEEKSNADLPSGVLVEQAAGPAARAGVQQGDVIVSVNGTPVKSVDQLRSIVSQQKKHLALLVQRGDAKIFIPVTLG